MVIHSHASENGQDTALHTRSHLVSGIILLALGVLALAFPFITSIGIELTLGVLISAFGLVEVIRAFNQRRTGKIVGSLLLGGIALILGLALLFFPVSGVVALSLFLMAFFVASGLMKLFTAYQIRTAPRASWLALSGGLSLALGLILIVALPGAALWVLGILVGVDLIFSGLAQIGLGTVKQP